MDYGFVMNSVLEEVKKLYHLGESSSLHDRVIADIVLHRRVQPRDQLIPGRPERYMDLDALGIVQVDENKNLASAPFCFVSLFLQNSSISPYRAIAPFITPGHRIVFWQQWEEFIAQYESLRATALGVSKETFVSADLLYGASLMNTKTKAPLKAFQLQVPSESSVVRAAQKFPESSAEVVQSDGIEIVWQLGESVIINAAGAAADVYTFWLPHTERNRGLHVFMQAKHTSPNTSLHSKLNLQGTLPKFSS